MKAGDRVKISDLAFANGVYHRNPTTEAMRGTVLNQKRADSAVLRVQWDTRKTKEYLHEDFLQACEAGGSPHSPKGISDGE